MYAIPAVPAPTKAQLPKDPNEGFGGLTDLPLINRFETLTSF